MKPFSPKALPKMRNVVTTEGYWYKTPMKIYHTCCTCNSKHFVEFKINNGVIYSKWKPLTKGKQSLVKLSDKRSRRKVI